MFNSDNPIKLRSDDLLERDPFCKYLAKSILKYQDDETLTIGLLGKWGSGKTSIVNLTLQHIENDFLDNPERKPIIIKFNPWNFSDQNNLIFQFFKVLSNNLKRKEYSKVLNKAGEIIEEYSEYLEPIVFPLTGIPGLSKIPKLIGKSLKDYGDKKAKDIEKIKESIIKKFTQSERKIIIIIDDIDRLTNSEIRQIFQLVKSLADFPNVIYILSFDKEIVCEALKEVQKGDGSEFIEKIIQVPLDVPLAQKSEIYNLLFEELNKIIKDVPEKDFDNYYWGNIFNSGMDKCFENIRDVKRFMNIFNFGFTSIKEEVNTVDFLAITAIQVFIPELYDQLQKNRGLFVSENVRFPYTINNLGLNDEKTKYEEIIKMIPKNLTNEIIKILRRMFPKIIYIENENSFHYSDSSINEWLLKKNICHPDKFDTYFKLRLTSGDISNKEIYMIINTSSEFNVLLDKIRKLNETKKLSYFMSYLYADIDEIDIDKLKIILKVFLTIGDEFINVDRIFFVLTIAIIRRIKDKDELLNLLVEIFKNNCTGFQICCELIYFFLAEHKQDSTITVDLRILKEDNIEDLKSSISESMKKSAENKSLLENPNLHNLLYNWKVWGNENDYDTFISEILSDDALIIKFVTQFSHTVQSFGATDVVGKTTYDLKYNSLKDLVDVNEFVERIHFIIDSDKFEALGKREKESLNLFLKNKENKLGRNYSSNH